MAQMQTRPPALGTRNGLGIGNSSPASTDSEGITSSKDFQCRAVRWLARRTGVSVPAASAIAAANGWGRP